MKKIFSTASVHPRDRFACWYDVARKIIVDHDSQPTDQRRFEAEIQSGLLADLPVVLFETSGLSFSHERRHIAHTRSDELFICHLGSGELRLEQESREVQMEPGDIILVDPLLQYAGLFAGGSRMLLIKLPRRPLEARIGSARDMAARLIKPTTADRYIASALLGILPDCVGSLSPPAEELVKGQVLELTALSIASVGNESVTTKTTRSRAVARAKLRAVIETHLTDPDLKPRTVAAAVGISLRYANSLFAEENTSVMKYIQCRRLARCRRILEDPSQSNRTITEIAYSWGFTDMTHFARKFRTAFGLLPSEVRNRLAPTD
jgi:AraC family transcriptional activator of tynA and feaB